MSAVCPICDAPQDAGLACHSCTSALEQALRAVPGLVDDLNITLSKQARIGNPSGGGGLARERSPIHFGASDVADNLHNVVGTWARDLWTDSPFTSSVPIGTSSAASILLDRIDAIRRHPAVNELTDEIHDAVGQARRVIDRPADRIYVGTCGVETQDEYNEWITCTADVYAHPGATETVCRTCGITHDVAERRAHFLRQAEDRLVTVREAAQVVIGVTEAAIRGYIHRSSNPLAYRPGTKLIRLGDLLDLLVKQVMEKAS